MNDAEMKAEIVEAARIAVRYLPPPSFLRDSKGYAACRRLTEAVKALRLAERAAKVKP